MNDENDAKPNMNELVQQAAANQQRAQWEGWLEIRKKAIQDEFHAGKQFNHAIIFAGFAGFFGLWAIVKGMIESITLSISVLLMLFSGVVFIGWEVYRMVYLTLRISRAANAVENPSNTNEAIEAADKAERDSVVRLMCYWPWVLGASIIPALIAIGIFAYTLVENLLREIFV